MQVSIIFKMLSSIPSRHQMPYFHVFTNDNLSHLMTQRSLNEFREINIRGKSIFRAFRNNIANSSVRND